MRLLSLTLRFCIYCGADPLVRAGPPGPAFGNRTTIRPSTRKADAGVGRDQGVRPTRKVSGIGRKRLPHLAWQDLLSYD